MPPPSASRRDPALDLIRCIALGRVVLWHAFAATWMTLFTAIPLMFFVAGVLLGAAAEGHRHHKVALRRARRVLLPLWVYGVGVAVAGSHLQAGADASPETAWRALTWVLPVVDPAESTWHGGWFSNHLWYIRAYLWVVLFAPVFVAFARHLRIAVPLLLLGVLQLEAARAVGLPLIGGGAQSVLASDVLVYGIFVTLGMAYRARPPTLDRRHAAAGALAAAVGAAAWARLAGTPAGGVNESYPILLLLGIAWLLVAAGLEPEIRWIAERRAARWITERVSRRAVTIYLWHPVAIVAAYALVGDEVALEPALVIAATLVLTGAAVVFLGWVEDVAAGVRFARAPAFRFAAVATVAVTAWTAVPGVVVPSAGASSGPRRLTTLPPPSHRAPLANSAFERRAPLPTPTTPVGQPLPGSALTATLERWLTEHEEVQSVRVGVARAGHVWSGSAHRRGSPVQLPPDEPFGTRSITKTFTAALVLREVAAGRIALDRPMPFLPGVGRPPSGGITPRTLLQHTSGIVNYTDAIGYRPDRPLAPRAAVSMSLRTPLLVTPGSEIRYSNSNYLYLGLLLEHVTGRAYRDLVAEVAAAAGLQNTAVDPPAGARPGWTGFSSGGVRSTVADLARWGEALFRPGRVLPPSQLEHLTTLSELNLGLGTWPLCPCWTDPAGRKRYTAIGHYVGEGGLYHYPGEVTITVNLDRETPQTGEYVSSLGEALRGALRH